VIPVKLNKDGVDISDLEEKIKKYRNDARDKMFWGIYYTIPCFHNPTSIVFTPGKNYFKRTF
jgi:DNA-binding transcriptional MocR family regulator